MISAYIQEKIKRALVEHDKQYGRFQRQLSGAYLYGDITRSEWIAMAARNQNWPIEKVDMGAIDYTINLSKPRNT